jgi:hypothetical protein
MLKFLSSKTFLKWFHACATIAWLLMIPIAVLTPLKDSVPFLVAISLWALVGAHWGAWQATRAEEEAAQ